MFDSICWDSFHLLKVGYLLAVATGVDSAPILVAPALLNDWALMLIALINKFSFFLIIGAIIDLVNAEETIDFFFLNVLVIYLLNCYN